MKSFIVAILLLFSLGIYGQTYQFLNGVGNAITQEKFSSFYYSQTNFVIVKKGDLFGVLDTEKGMIINCEYEVIKGNKIHTDIFAVKKDGNWGIMNASGKILLPFEYEEIKFFDDEVAIVSIDFYWVLVNYKGEKLVDGEYEDVSEIYKKEKEAIWFQKNNRWDLFSRTGKKLTTQSFAYRGDAYGNIREASNGWHKSGAIDAKTGKLVVPLQYDKITPLTIDLIEVAKCRYEFDGFGPQPRPDDYYYGIYSASLQKEIVPCTYDKIEVTKEYIKAKISGRGDYYSHQGKVLNPENLKPSTDLNDLGYEEIIPAFDDIYVIKRKTGRYKWGILNYENNEFDWLEFLSGSYGKDDVQFIKSIETTFPFILFNSYGTIKIHGRDGKMIHQMKYREMDKVKTTATSVIYRNYDPKKGLVTYFEFSKDGSFKELSDFEDKDFIMPFKNDAGQYGLKKLDGTIVEPATHKNLEMKKFGESTVFIVKN